MIGNDHIPLWLAAHEAGHAIARIQLVAAWRLHRLDGPDSVSSIRVWRDQHGEPRGLCQWGPEPLSFPYQAIISAAGSVAEARIRHTRKYTCLTSGEDHEILMRSVKRGWADIDDALREASFIIRSCWRSVVTLAEDLQQHRELDFAAVQTSRPEEQSLRL